MDKRITYFFALLLFGCGQTITPKDLHHLNGYWEIILVKFPDGGEKPYTISTTIDYIVYEDGKGFQKKVQPQLNGTFKTSNDAIAFTIISKDNSYFLRYEEEPTTREAQLVELDKNILVMRNSEGLAYHYKRFEPFTTKP